MHAPSSQSDRWSVTIRKLYGLIIARRDRGSRDMMTEERLKNTDGNCLKMKLEKNINTNERGCAPE